VILSNISKVGAAAIHVCYRSFKKIEPSLQSRQIRKRRHFQRLKHNKLTLKIPIGEKDTPPRQAGLLTIAAAMMVVAGLSYLAAELIRIDAWISPTYSWTVNKVPDLGSPFCGLFQGRMLCSPLHNVMNAGFLIEGTLLGIATLLFSRSLIGRARVAAAVLAVAHWAGLLLAVVFPCD